MTPPGKTKQGFFEQALRKTQEASPYIERANLLSSKLEKITDPSTALDNTEIFNDLITSAGFSDKAVQYFSRPELKNAFVAVIKEMESQTNGSWRQELVYRYLLTRGDTLGGIMRNITGATARTKLIEAICTTLANNGIKSTCSYSSSNKERVQSISWTNRLLVFDLKPAIIDKSVDAILLKDSHVGSAKQLLAAKENYLACGELKGGIDPAGADEHWKTASGAFDRIQQKLGTSAKLFFVGAAIERAMAQEIFSQLQSEKLCYAANLNMDNQVSDLANWLVSL